MAPDAPTSVTGTANDGAATVHWAASADDGGSPITGYTVTASPGPMQCTTTGALACAVLGLTNDASYTFTVQAKNAIGTSAASTPSAPVTPTGSSPAVDNVPPTVPPASSAVAANQHVGSTSTLHVSWPPATDAGTVVEYSLERSVNSGPWTGVTLPSPTALSVDVQLGDGDSQALRLAALDDSGNWSAPLSTSAATLSLFQENEKPPLSYVGTFKRSGLSGASGGYVKRTGAAGRTATFSFTGSSAGWVSTMGPTRGIAEVWLDGSMVGSVDLYAASLSVAQVVWATEVAPGTHTVQVVVTGTHNAAATGSRIDVDSFLAY